MMSPEAIHELSQEAGKAAAERNRKPYFPTPQELALGPLALCRAVPNLGDYRPKGFVLVDHWLVDSSGMGSENEPALTAKQFHETAKNLAPNEFGYAIVEEGQFQVVIGVFQHDFEQED